jgi:hypothetical protein
VVVTTKTTGFSNGILNLDLNLNLFYRWACGLKLVASVTKD